MLFSTGQVSLSFADLINCRLANLQRVDQPADMKFLSEHSQDGLTFTNPTSSHLVYTASYTQAGSENPNIDCAHGCALHDCCGGSIISGFVCEYYAAPGSIGIGLAQQFDQAEAMCRREFGGHLLSIHDQQTMDKLITLTTGYTNPVLIGLQSDGAGNWECKQPRSELHLLLCIWIFKSASNIVANRGGRQPD